MKTGAVAILDILGFKGIWRRFDAETVMSRLEDLRQSFENDEHKDLRTAVANFTRSEEGSSNIQIPDEDEVLPCTVRFLSDSVFVASALTLRTVDLNVDLETDLQELHTFFDALCLARVAKSVVKIVQHGLSASPAFAYRGCISFGEYEDRDKFIVGPAVDEAAELERLAEGAIVWLGPSAHAVLEQINEGSSKPHVSAMSVFIQRFFLNDVFVPFAVPLKGSPDFNTLAVSPLSGLSIEEAEAFESDFMSTFDQPGSPTNLSILIKKDITRRFLSACRTEEFDRTSK